MFTDNNLNLGSYEVIYIYMYVDKPDNLFIHTHHNRLQRHLQHIKIDMYVDNSYLTTLLLLQNKIAIKQLLLHTKMIHAWNVMFYSITL
jgi:hypothetical protein